MPALTEALNIVLLAGHRAARQRLCVVSYHRKRCLEQRIARRGLRREFIKRGCAGWRVGPASESGLRRLWARVCLPTDRGSSFQLYGKVACRARRRRSNCERSVCSRTMRASPLVQGVGPPLSIHAIAP